MPFTKIVFLIGSLALVGIPPFAGFFSKDPIIAAALDRGWFGIVIFVADVIGTFLTGLYAFRLYFIVFTGEPTAFAREHFHAAPRQGGAALDALDGRRARACSPRSAASCSSRRSGHPLTDWLEPVAAPLVEPTNTQELIASVLAVAAGLAGMVVAWAIYSAKRARGAEARAPVREEVLLGRALRPDLVPPRRRDRARALRVRRAAADRRARSPPSRGGAGFGSRELGRAQNGLVRSYALALASGIAVLDRRLRERAMNHWLTTILIFLPVAGALLVAVAPLPALLARLARGADLARRGRLLDLGGRTFDFGDPGLQFEQRHAWFDDLGVSYHVGQYAFSLWLVGATVVVMAACVIYGWWVGRDRARAYFSLMLMLTGAIVGVFTAQDLLLFYAFFEAMLIPLYVLIGVWGGPQRLRATLTFVIYTVVGSLLMLASIVVFGLQQGTFDLTKHGHVVLDVALPRLRGRVRDQVAALPVPRLAADHLPRVAARGVGGALRHRLEGRSLRPAADRDPEVPDVVDDWRVVLLVLASISLVYGSLLAFRAPDFRGVVLYSSLAQSGLIALGLFANNDLGFDGAVLQMVNHALISATLFLLAGMVERRTSTGEFRLLGGMARGRPALATLLHDDRRHLARRAALDVVRRRVPDPRRRLPAGLGLGRRRRRRRSCWRRCTCCARSRACCTRTSARRCPTPRSTCALGELAVVVPLVLCLLGLSAWPNLISGRAFGGNHAAAQVDAELADAPAAESRSGAPSAASR